MDPTRANDSGELVFVHVGRERCMQNEKLIPTPPPIMFSFLVADDTLGFRVEWDLAMDGSRIGG